MAAYPQPKKDEFTRSAGRKFFSFTHLCPVSNKRALANGADLGQTPENATADQGLRRLYKNG